MTEVQPVASRKEIKKNGKISRTKKALGQTRAKKAVKPRKAPTSSRKKIKAAVPQERQGGFIVGIGASAGGLEALQRFFHDMQSDSGLAFVVVQHLDASRESMMQELLKRCTAMPVFQIEDGMRIERNCVYTIPPNRYIAVLRGAMHLLTPDLPRGIRLPIDFFFRSLAEDQGDRAVCIVLSGAGSDGTLGLRAVKAAGGMTMAQEEGSARYDSMPHSAILTGCVDYILPVENMPRQLMRYIHHSHVAKSSAPDQPDMMDRIFILLRGRTGHDFTYYKRNTVNRRIARRMALHQIADIENYAHYLQQNKTEIDALFQELLIGVTGFFRDREAFAALQEKILPRLFEHRTSEGLIRVWLPGCSTGEEVYSVAMLLAETREQLSATCNIQIFGTDIDEEALEVARVGLYPAAIAADVSAERLQRFFTAEDGGYRVKKHIREMVILAKQDLIKDPPFSKLDLIVCRNLLIYLSHVLQKKILPLFHYTLNPHGFLMLGPSETIGESLDLFSLIDKKWKLFQRKTGVRMAVDFPLFPSRKEKLEVEKGSAKSGKEANLTQVMERMLLEDYAPASVIINERYDIVHFHGRTRQYLEPPGGQATLNILKMARPELRLELRSAIHKAFRQHSVVVQSGVRLKDADVERAVSLVVKPVEQDTAQGLMMVVFDEAAIQPNGGETTSEDTAADQRAMELEYELNSTKESLQTTIEELETSNEELKSTNEELQSTNEELQSTNEELETSKEELQSVNEELVTVNSELQVKLEELSQASNDMLNLLSSTEVGIIFLDRNLRIKRYTPPVCKVFNLIPADWGRPISHMVHNFDYAQLHEDIEQVLETLAPKERQLQTKEGVWYFMKIVPYRTLDDAIDGVVLSFVDISQIEQLKRENLAVETALRHTQNIVETLREPLLVLDKDLCVVSVNAAYHHFFKTNGLDTEGRSIFALGDGQWNIPAFNTLLQEVVQGNNGVDDFLIEADFAPTGRRRFTVNARKIRLQESTMESQVHAREGEFILLAIYDAP